MDKKMEPKWQRPAEPATHPLQGGALSAQSWSLRGAGRLECVCCVRRACKGCCPLRRPCFLPRKMPAVRKEKKYISDKIL